MSEHS